MPLDVATNYLRMVSRREPHLLTAGTFLRGQPATIGIAHLRRLAGRTGEVCVPDTNALLHYTNFDQLNWAERLGVKSVRLVIPLAVIDELDGKKYSRREEFQNRARDLLIVINRLITDTPYAYAKISDSLTVELQTKKATFEHSAMTRRF